MDETINTFLIENPFELIPMSRKEFYAEQVSEYKKNGEPTRAVEIINVFLFNSHGELIIQKRSFDKNHNPGLLDKSIGGHIKHGDSAGYTVMVETIQELQTPSIVLENENDFIKTYDLLKPYLETISVITHLSTILLSPIKIINNEDIKIANKMHIYLGVYDGRIRPVDREAKGVLFYSLSEIKNEMLNNPNTFTDDMRLILRKYEKEIQHFINLIQKQS